MTSVSIGFYTALALAILAGLVAVLKYITSDVVPQLAALFNAVADLKAAHALSTQVIQQNTARLNGQSAKIDTLQLAAPAAPVIIPVPVAAPLPASGPAGAAPAPVPEKGAPPALDTTAPAPVPVPPSVNVTVQGTLTSEGLAAAHTQLDLLAQQNAQAA